MVLAVEPDAWLSSLLVRSAGFYDNVQVLTAAVQETMGLAELNIAQRGRSANFVRGFGTEQSGGARFRQTVVSVTLDWLSERFSPPDVLKIDVEGMEKQVLAGGALLLRRSKPIIISEVLPPNSIWVTEFLTAAGYRLHDREVGLVKRAGATTIAIPSDNYESLLSKLKSSTASRSARPD